MRKTERGLTETNKFLSLQGIIAMAVVGTALLLFTVVFIIWLTRVHQEGEEGEYPMRNVNRIVNSLKRGTLQRKEDKKPRHCSSSSDSDEDIENLMLRKMNNDVPRDQPWFKSRK